MKQFATFDEFFRDICTHMANGISNFPAEKLDAIGKDIVAEWVGEPKDPNLQGVASGKSELVWRTIYLQQAILDIRQILVLAKAVPIKSIGLSRSEQLKFVWWAYLNSRP